MISLKNSTRFQTEYNRYKEAIDKITVPQAKRRGQDLLSKLMSMCNFIDEGHNSRNNGNIDPRALRDNVISLLEIRKELDQIVKDSKN